MQIAILCNFVTLTINFIRMPISDILFLRFSAYFTKKRTAPPPHAEGRRMQRHEFLCIMHAYAMRCFAHSIGRFARPDRPGVGFFADLFKDVQSDEKSVSAGTPSVFMIFIRNAAANTRAGRLRRLRYPLRLSNASQTSLTRSSISSIRINVAILYFGGDIHQHVYMTRT